jgi:hypothetical protein
MSEKIAVVDNALRSELRRNLTSDERGQLADMLIRLQSNLSQILDGSEEA